MKWKKTKPGISFWPWHETMLVLRTGRGKIWLLTAVLGIASILTLSLLRGLQHPQPGQVFLAILAALLPLGWLAGISVHKMRAIRHMRELGAEIKSHETLQRLANVDIICADKTGLFTENRLSVVAMDVAGQENPKTLHSQSITDSPSRSLLLLGGALCNDAELLSNDDGNFHALGDLTDSALAVTAARAGFTKTELDKAFVRVGTIPFDNKRKRMTTVHELSDYVPGALSGIPVTGMSHIVFTKGALDKLLHRSKTVWVDGEIQKLDKEWQRRIRSAENKMTARGMRVLGLAFRTLPALSEKDFERELTFVGLVGMVDLPHHTIEESIELCRKSGIRPLIISDDRPATVQQWLPQFGLEPSSRIITGTELEQISDAKLQEIVENVQVYVRISPTQRARLIGAAQKNGHVVADASEDQPVTQADVQIGLGPSASFKAADLTLLEGHFSSLVAVLLETRSLQRGFGIFFYTALSGLILRFALLGFALWLGWSFGLVIWLLIGLNLLLDGGIGLLVSLGR